MHYSSLSKLLLNDDDSGTVTSAIVAEHKHTIAINQEILWRWLQGHGKQPVTWSTLICVLRDMKLLELAQMIKNDIIKVQIQEQEKKNYEYQQQLESHTQELHKTKEDIGQLRHKIKENVQLYICM